MTINNYSFGPLRIADTSPLAQSAARGLQWLLESQNSDGTWGNDNALDRLISTCHACLTLLAAGYAPSSTPIARGLDYLKSDEVANNDTGFWRIAPLAGVPGAESAVQESIGKLRRNVHGDASPNPDQLLTVFLMKTYLYLNDRTRATELVPRVMSRFDEQECWASRADSTSHAISVLLNLLGDSGELLPHVLERSRRLIAETAVANGPGMSSWCGRVSSTAYTMINIVECSLWDDSVLQRRTTRAAAWIQSRQEVDGSWPTEDPPYGGAALLTSRCYFTAVAVRGLIAYGATVNEGLFLELEHSLAALNRQRVVARESALNEATRELEKKDQRRRASVWRWRILALALFSGLVLVVAYRNPQLLSELANTVLLILAILTAIVTVIDFTIYLRRGVHSFSWRNILRLRRN